MARGMWGSIRTWRPDGWFLFLALGWSGTIVSMLVTIANQWDEFPELATALVPPLAVCVIGTVAVWNRPDVGDWHVAKLLVAWILFAFAAFWIWHIEDDFGIVFLFCGAPPLLVFTFSWPSGRERSHHDAGA